MNKRWVLRFNATNKASKQSFVALGDGTKTVETRAATEKYRKVEVGDVLVFACGLKRLEKKVKRVKIFKSVDALLLSVPMKRVNPWAKSKLEVKAGYESYTGYKEKIKKFGLVAFYI